MIWPLRMVLTPVQASPWRSPQAVGCEVRCEREAASHCAPGQGCSLEAWRGRRSAGGVEGADEVGGDVCRIL